MKRQKIQEGEKLTVPRHQKKKKREPKGVAHEQIIHTFTIYFANPYGGPCATGRHPEAPRMRKSKLISLRGSRRGDGKDAKCRKNGQSMVGVCLADPSAVVCVAVW